MVKIEDYGIVSTEGCDNVSESILMQFINADPKGFNKVKKKYKESANQDLGEAINIAREEIGKKIKSDALTGNLSREEIINRATLIVLHKAGIINDLYQSDFVFYVLALRGFDKPVRISSCARPSCGFMISALHHEKNKKMAQCLRCRAPMLHTVYYHKN